MGDIHEVCRADALRYSASGSPTLLHAKRSLVVDERVGGALSAFVRQ